MIVTLFRLPLIILLGLSMVLADEDEQNTARLFKLLKLLEYFLVEDKNTSD